MMKFVLGLLMAFCTLLAQAAVDVNKATQAELETVRGIGPAMSGRILEERGKSGFKDWTDLIDRVKGVGPGNAARYSEAGLTVNGGAYTGDAKPKQVSRKTAAAPATPAAADKVEKK